jgi:hypothetical protein
MVSRGPLWLIVIGALNLALVVVFSFACPALCWL